MKEHGNRDWGKSRWTQCRESDTDVDFETGYNARGGNLLFTAEIAMKTADKRQQIQGSNLPNIFFDRIDMICRINVLKTQSKILKIL